MKYHRSSCDRVTVCQRAAVSDSWNVSSSSARTLPHPCTLRFAGPFEAHHRLLRRHSVLGTTGQGRARESRKRRGQWETGRHNAMEGDEGSASARPGDVYLCWRRRMRSPLPLLLPLNRPRLRLDLLVAFAWKPSSFL
ncbi:unnamed protein product [Ectocarpus sp. 4 AP-2014]